jgi:hypothetical protein
MNADMIAFGVRLGPCILTLFIRPPVLLQCIRRIGDLVESQNQQQGSSFSATASPHKRRTKGEQQG